MTTREQDILRGIRPFDGPASFVATDPVVQTEQPPLSAQSFQRIITYAEILADFATTILGVYAAYLLYITLNVGKRVHYPTRDLAFVSTVVALVVVLLFERDAAYEGSTSLLRIRETERSLRIPFIALLLLLPISFLMGYNYSRGTLLCATVVIPLALIIQKSIFLSVVQSLHARGYGVRRILIYGAGYTGRKILTALLHSPKLGLMPVAVTDDDAALEGTAVYELGYTRKRSFPIHTGPITPEYLKSVGCNIVIVAIPSMPHDTMLLAQEAAVKAGVKLAFIPDRLYLNGHSTESVDLDGLMLTFSRDLAATWHYTILKRSLDLAVSGLLLCLLLPFYLLVALLIRMDSPGPVFFQQERVGRNGQRFNIFKLRSMHVHAPKYAKSPVGTEDNRITRVGKYLRKTSLDELPQLINVLRGEMSLVGPRPEMPFLVAEYNVVQRQRLQVIPGITGLWQLSADRAFLIHESPEYDMYYIRNRGMFMDLAILIHTVFFAMRGI